MTYDSPFIGLTCLSLRPKIKLDKTNHSIQPNNKVDPVASCATPEVNIVKAAMTQHSEVEASKPQEGTSGIV